MGALAASAVAKSGKGERRENSSLFKGVHKVEIKRFSKNSSDP
jgi:hypothetical protein